MHCESFSLEPNCEGEVSENADIKKEVGQGWILFPLLLTLYAEEIISETLIEYEDRISINNSNLIN